MKSLLSEIKQFFTVKLLISIVTIGGILPLVQALYWTFEASYFGYFGVSPEIFSRPIFSSGFISVWLFVSSAYPAFLTWSGLMGILFVFLTVFNFEPPEFAKTKSSDGDQPQTREKTSEQNSKTKKLSKHTLQLMYNLVDAISKSLNLPLVFWAGGFLVLMISLLLFVGADNAGRKLAKEQIDNYSKENFECLDGINNNNIGCFSISGIKGDDHLVITNNKTHLIYLSRNKTPGTDQASKTKSAEIELHIIEKTDAQTFHISRKYKQKL
ncbi:hypothetical protein FT643_09275 [Ketobacter sp. MCCC 1A13808]|uniref:hypothetical protein n=1 Tax=Ketobacter sp. MCCC 1A13808 TaxID=2602738 RepID=UPI0012EBDA9F|nr:hypothetical protein [Ketobacter sp. MCCC 1A13808]MVF12335.1 hypothetical protein [Ketobacter sp. MCCC 1A13808]